MIAHALTVHLHRRAIARVRRNRSLNDRRGRNEDRHRQERYHQPLKNGLLEHGSDNSSQRPNLQPWPNGMKNL
jgi:hypothetical protein